MARYNTIWAGPDSENMPQKIEAIVTSAVLPGTIVTLSGANFIPAIAATATAVYVVQDNYLTMKNVDDAIPANSTCMGLITLDEQFVNVRIATGISVAKGAGLALGAAGTVVLATAGSRIIGYADETYNNTSGASQLVRMRAIAGYRLSA